MRPSLKISAMAWLLANLAFSPAPGMAQVPQEATGPADRFAEEAKKKFEASDLQGALLEFDSAIKSAPKRVSSYYLRAFCKDSLGDFNGALADCNQAIALDPSRAPAAYMQRAITEYHLDR